MSINVAVVGAHGRMGTTVCEAVEAADDMSLVACLDAGDEITQESLAAAEVVVEFSVPDVTLANVLSIIDAGKHVVVGTTGWNDEMLEKVKKASEDKGVGVLIAPNFSVSAVLLMRFAQMAAPFFESVEVIELHHPNKVDAPSGTAMTTAKRIAQARLNAGIPESPDATQTDPHGARGANIDGVHVHAVRQRGLFANEEVLFGNPGEQMILRQNSFERESYMPGVLLAVRKVLSRPGLTYGLDSIMQFS